VATRLGSFASFIAVWVVMMAAMMLPSFAPTLGAYVTLARSRAQPMAVLRLWLPAPMDRRRRRRIRDLRAG
jgi:predicted metal-binding membrane protein